MPQVRWFETRHQVAVARTTFAASKFWNVTMIQSQLIGGASRVLHNATWVNRFSIQSIYVSAGPVQGLDRKAWTPSFSVPSPALVGLQASGWTRWGAPARL